MRRSASSTVASVDTGLLAADAAVRDLWPRVISALLLVPAAVAVVYAGGIVFQLAMMSLAVLMVWEWNGLCNSGAVAIGAASGAAVVAAVGTTAFIGGGYGLAVLAVTALAPWLIARRGGGRSIWAAGGTIYVGVPCLAAVWLREASPLGFEIVLWLLTVVWATDIGAYFSGRKIGGPKLAPVISPNKTWSGLIGGVLFAALVGGVMGAVMDRHELILLAAFGAALAVVAQSGDLFESKIKRHFGADDSGHLIPGHGGVLDRLDGVLAVLPLVAGLHWCFAGGGGSFWPWR